MHPDTVGSGPGLIMRPGPGAFRLSDGCLRPDNPKLGMSVRDLPAVSMGGPSEPTFAQRL